MKDQQLYTVVFKQFVGEGFQGLCYEHSLVLLHSDTKQTFERHSCLLPSDSRVPLYLSMYVTYFRIC